MIAIRKLLSLLAVLALILVPLGRPVMGATPTFPPTCTPPTCTPL